VCPRVVRVALYGEEPGGHEVGERSIQRLLAHLEASKRRRIAPLRRYLSISAHHGHPARRNPRWLSRTAAAFDAPTECPVISALRVLRGAFDAR